ncbi:MAG: hypothetical protein ACYDA3_10600 [Gaiellaceae bacterium]
MTASYLGLALLDALLLVAGLGLLFGLGLVRSRRDGVRHAGLALVAGWASAGIVESTALTLGAPVTRWVVLAICVAIAAAGAALGRRVRARRMAFAPEAGFASWVAVAGAAILLVQLAGLLRRALAAGAPLQWDAWAFWLPKAKSIIDFGGLDTGVGGFTSFANPSYPPLVPAVEASAFAFMGNTDAAPLALQHWVIAVAFFAAIASLLAGRVRPSILWPSLAMLAVLPTVTALIGSSLGDEPLMLLVGLGGACSALWLLERDPRFAALAGLFFAAGALAKVEGLAIALVIAATAFVGSVARRPRQPIAPLLLLLAPVAAVVPWKLWLRTHRVPLAPDYRLSDLLHPALLGDRIHRLTYAVRVLPAHVFGPGRWLIAIPLLLAAVALAARRRPALSLLALAPVVAIPAGLLLVYWIGYPPVGWYVTTTADRVVASAVVFAMVIVPLLLAEASRPEPPPG